MLWKTNCGMARFEPYNITMGQGLSILFPELTREANEALTSHVMLPSEAIVYSWFWSVLPRRVKGSNTSVCNQLCLLLGGIRVDYPIFSSRACWLHSVTGNIKRCNSMHMASAVPSLFTRFVFATWQVANIAVMAKRLASSSDRTRMTRQHSRWSP